MDAGAGAGAGWRIRPGSVSAMDMSTSRSRRVSSRADGNGAVGPGSGLRETGVGVLAHRFGM